MRARRCCGAWLRRAYLAALVRGFSSLPSLSQVLIYVFDIESQQLEKDIQYFTLCIEALKSNSDNAKVFCLVRMFTHTTLAEFYRKIISF